MDEASKKSVKDVLPVIQWETIAPPYETSYAYFQGSSGYPFRYQANLFDMVNAWWLIDASILAYSDPPFAEPRFVQAGLPQVRFFSGPGTQCYVAHNDRFVIVAFRGTEIRARTGSKDLRNILPDILADLNVLPVSWGHGGKVHQGFRLALDEVWEAQGLVDHIQELDNHGQRTVWFTGHSLGAALATLAADRYGNVRGLYTFGSPRVGDAEFGSDFHVSTYRFVNNNDIVTRVPPPIFYRHVGNLKYIDHQGVIHDNPGRWEKCVEWIRGEAAYIFNSLGQIRSGFARLIPDDLIDHVPLLYAVHIWNNIP